MNNILQQILHLFSSNSILDISENYSEVKAEVVCNNGNIPTDDAFNAVMSNLNGRDGLHISILQGDDDNPFVQNYSSTEEVGQFSLFIQNIASILQGDNFKIIITIEKKKINQQLSVYYVDQFLEYLNSLPFVGLLFVFDKLFNNEGIIIFEVQDNLFKEISTRTIKFIPQGKVIVKDEILERTERLNKIKNLCHCSLVSKYQFIPEDFYLLYTSNNIILKKLFGRITLLYSAIFLFDIFNTDANGSVEYKLNGYRTINQKIDISNIDVDSYEIYYEIYSWVYEGGNIVDKIGLARNILSLNFDKESLKLSETTFEAIKSGFKIYQKENIKQYIEIRNKISDQLIELQNKADKIVDGFISDYKKSLFTVVSFFISVIVIRVVSKGDFTGGFTIEVTILSIGFLIISLVVMFFARWEINKQIVRYDEFYKHLKERYEDLLDKSDIIRILNNDTDFNSNKSFIKNKQCIYTILWIISLLFLFVIVVSLYFINHPCIMVDGFSTIFKKIILCFTGNISQ